MTAAGPQNSRQTPVKRKPDLVLTRIFDAPRELVFRAWTDPQHVAQWWGPDEFTVPHCELDVRPGGAILVLMRGPDGTMYPTEGIFQEVVEPERLVFTSFAYPDESGSPQLEVLHTVTFEEQQGKTLVTLKVVVIKVAPEVAEVLSGMEPGWRQGFERLARHLAAI